MSSEAITQNDLREILSRTVGSIPSEYKKLLWTNPNPSVAFGAQTVVSGIDVSAYDDIEVIIKANINVGIGKSNIFKYASAGTWAVSGPPTVNDTWVGVRRVTINATSISFGNGGYAYWSSTSANYAHNDYAIPLAVYGIKYERVEPPQLETPIIQTLTVTAQTDANGYFHPPTSLNDAIPIWAEVSGRPTGLRPCFLTNGYTETERYGLRFKAWNDVVAYTSTTITVTIYYIKLVN